MSKIEVDTIAPQSGTTLTVGESGDTVDISNATLSANLNASDLSSGTIPDARFPATLPAVDGSNLTGVQVTGGYIIIDPITVTNTDTFALTSSSVAVSPASASNCIVSLNGVIQAPITSYTISGSNIIFASALTAGSDVIDFITVLGSALNVGTVSDGTISLSKLSATGTKDATTFLRGDNTFAAAGGGKILQVVQTSKTDTFSSTSTGANDITGMSVTITPSASDSKILILGTICTDATNNANIRLFRGSTLISVGDAASNRTRSSAGEGRASGSAAQDFVSNSLTFLDSPATTSATTYKVGYYLWTGGGTFYLNRSSSDTDNAYEWRAASNIIAIEVGA